MLKRGLLFLVIVSLLCTYAAGCSKSDADRIVGSWEGSIESGAYPLAQKYVFDKDGTGTYQFKSVKTMVPPKFQYRIEGDGVLVFSALYMNDVVAGYAFNEDYTVLTLTIDDKSYELQKAKK